MTVEPASNSGEGLGGVGERCELDEDEVVLRRRLVTIDIDIMSGESPVEAMYTSSTTDRRGTADVGGLLAVRQW